MAGGAAPVGIDPDLVDSAVGTAGDTVVARHGPGSTGFRVGRSTRGNVRSPGSSRYGFDHATHREHELKALGDQVTPKRRQVLPLHRVSLRRIMARPVPSTNPAPVSSLVESGELR